MLWATGGGGKERCCLVAKKTRLTNPVVRGENERRGASRAKGGAIIQKTEDERKDSVREGGGKKREAHSGRSVGWRNVVLRDKKGSLRGECEERCA